MPTSRKTKAADLAFIAMFAAIMAVCAWISIPATVPFTMQTFGVFLTVGVLGGRRGTLAVLTYLLLGLAGAPVFAGFAGGIGCLANLDGGYLIGFLFTALVMWAFERAFGKRKWALSVSMAVGLLACYLFGTVWFMVLYAGRSGPIGVWTALTWCVIPYLVPDIVKIVLALFLRKRMAHICQLD